MTTRFLYGSFQRFRGGGIALLVVLFVCIGIWSGSAGAATLGQIVDTTKDSSLLSISPKVAQDPAGNVHVVFVSSAGSQTVRYVKGVWQGTGYVFGGMSVLDDVGNFGYGTPSVAVAPNGTIMAAWSNGTNVLVKTWDSNANQPSGKAIAISSDHGLETSIATDSSSRFHVAWNGDFKMQYCQFENGQCSFRDTFSGGTNTNHRPAVAVDSGGGVHIVWDQGSGILYRRRAPGQAFGPIESLDNGAGNFARIAADGQGNVHMVWSRDYAVQYCSRTLTNRGCQETHTISQGSDVAPSVAATRDGHVVVTTLDLDKHVILFDSKDNGAWKGPARLSPAPTYPLMGGGEYTNRVSVVWSANYDIQHALLVADGVAAATPTMTPPPPTPTMPPPPAGNGTFATAEFQRTWERTDLAVSTGKVSRSWIWGPQPNTGAHREAYSDSPGGTRLVQYFDKSRMEINDPATGQVTNGLIVEEMIAGKIQVGNAAFRQAAPAQQAVAGDPIEHNAAAPTYASFVTVAFPTNMAHAPSRIGQNVIEVLHRDGTVTYNGDLTKYGVTLATYDATLGHNVPGVFQQYFAQRGLVFEGDYHDGQVIDPLFVVGLPLSEPYWATVKVAGVDKDVLMQAFERRVVTFTPSNPAGFQIEMGNAGQHYLRWRYRLP
ncbi:MAG: hypothetical protein NVS4B8_02420 [Herpetosiphon sp.]